VGATVATWIGQPYPFHPTTRRRTPSLGPGGRARRQGNDHRPASIDRSRPPGSHGDMA
jgi:hypothetical protein